MKAEELKDKTLDELNKLLLDLKKKQFNLRFQISQGQLENTAKIRAVRRDVARVKTFISQQRQSEAKKAAPPKAKKTGKKAA